ncbi:MAG: polysaccharide biosynthesis/export family protein [Thermodesulfobacteriota bacterium]|nr:polysaccharide biosynthesis/export family protein [Thermodesulfobacteriota bacterium]
MENSEQEGSHVISTKPPPQSPFNLGSGDRIAIKVWRNDDLNREVQIDPSGNIYFPLAGEIHASGLTISQLREEITKRLSKYLINPYVDVNVSNLSSQKIHVLGEVRSPGTFTLEPDTMAWEAVSKAGGFTTDANKKKVLLVRANENDQATIKTLNIHDIFKHGTISRDMYLKNDDVIYVMPTFIANLARFMTQLNSIINPFVNVERGIVLYPDAADVLRGQEKERDILVAP